MIAKIEGSINDKNGILSFEILDTVEVELIVAKADYQQPTSTYKSGAIIEGFPAMVKLTDISGNEHNEEGVLVESGNGHYLIPFNFVKEIESDTIVDKIEEEVEKVVDTIKSTNEKEILGFSYKQILVIGIMAVVVTKIMK